MGEGWVLFFYGYLEWGFDFFFLEGLRFCEFMVLISGYISVLVRGGSEKGVFCFCYINNRELIFCCLLVG